MGMSSGRHKRIVDDATEIGRCLAGGALIETPFDAPIEEERRGDPDQRDDDANFDRERVVYNIEGIQKKDVKDLSFNEKVKFFLDGSLRTKFIGEYVDQDSSFPILTAEVACCALKRDAKKLHPVSVNWLLTFIFPHKDTGLLSDTQYKKLKDLGEKFIDSGSRIRVDFLQKSDTRDVRYSMQGKARDIMHTLEHETARELVRNNDEWLIMDGAIRKAEFLSLNNTIGVAKSFSRKPIFQVDDSNSYNITRYLSTIGEGQRSAVFKQNSQSDVAFWYLRIRTFPPMEPLGGFVKIDYKLGDASLNADAEETIDQLSAEIYSMRSPSVYPYPRWPSFLYPIRLAEETMQSAFINDEMLSYYGHVIKEAIGEKKSGGNN